jgi:hypothetical protein
MVKNDLSKLSFFLHDNTYHPIIMSPELQESSTFKIDQGLRKYMVKYSALLLLPFWLDFFEELRIILLLPKANNHHCPPCIQLPFAIYIANSLSCCQEKV